MTFRWICLFGMLFLAAAPPASAQEAGLLTKAQAGDAAAQVAVGDTLATGGGSPRSPKQIEAGYRAAAEWYRMAADQKSPDGQKRMAALFRDGKGVARDLAQAAALYCEAAEEGDAEAQATLATLYTFGQGVSRSDVEAYFWFDVAAQLPGPNQQKYAANRQLVGTRITAQELEAVQGRVEIWLAAHRVTKTKP